LVRPVAVAVVVVVVVVKAPMVAARQLVVLVAPVVVVVVMKVEMVELRRPVMVVAAVVVGVRCPVVVQSVVHVATVTPHELLLLLQLQPDVALVVVPMELKVEQMAGTQKAKMLARELSRARSVSIVPRVPRFSFCEPHRAVGVVMP
jgi:hypothetical protein